MSSTRLAAAAALALALAVPAAAFAQQAPAPTTPVAGHRHHRNAFREALGRLDLSPAQRSQIDQAFAQNRAASKGADRETKRANRAHLRAQVEGILTPAQRTQLRDALRAERRAPAPTAPH